MSFVYPAARILVSLVNIAIAAIIIMSVYPLVTDGLKVDVPNSEDIVWRYSHGNVTLTAPFGITNGGFFDINDVEIAFTVSNQSGSHMIDTVNQWGTIPAGSHSTRDIDMALDIPELISKGFGWMMFHSDRLIVEVTVTAKYTMKLILFSAEREIQMPWEAVLQDFGFGQPSLTNSSGNYSLQMPFFIDTASVLLGSHADFTVYVNNGTGAELMAATQRVDLGKNYSSALDLPIAAQAAFDLLLHNQTLTVEIEVAIFPGFSLSFSKQVVWTAPLHW